VLERHIQHLLTRPVGRPPKKPVVRYHSFMYQAGSWDHERRVVAKVEWHQGELFPRVGFIVTNLIWRNKRVVRFYNQRGTAEEFPAHYVGKHNLCQGGRSAYSVRTGIVGAGPVVPATAAWRHRRCPMSHVKEDVVPPRARPRANPAFL